MIGLGEIFYNIELSVIASSIFYYFTSYKPQKIQKERLSRIISEYLSRFALISNTVKTDITKDTNCTEDGFIKVILQLNFSEKADKTLSYILDGAKYNFNFRWYEYFEEFYKDIHQTYDCLKPYWHFLPDDIIATLSEISAFDESFGDFLLLENDQNYMNNKEHKKIFAKHLWDQLQKMNFITEQYQETL